MGILGFLDTDSDSPSAAVLQHLSANDFIKDGDVALSEGHIVLTDLEADDCDAAWSWSLAASAPTVRDGQGEQFIEEAGKMRRAADDERTPVSRGIVAEFDGYGGYVVVTDTDGEDDDALLDYAAGQLD